MSAVGKGGEQYGFKTNPPNKRSRRQGNYNEEKKNFA
jgi:hypothetical protein